MLRSERRPVRFRQLEYFVAVAEELHFTRAAASVGVSQPVLSRQIQALEAELGVSLLTRTNRDVSVTPVGRSFLDKARIILAQVEDARSIAATTNHSLRVATYGTGGTALEKSVLDAYAEASASVRVEILILDWGDVAPALRDGRVDVGFVAASPTGRFSTHKDLMLAPLRRDPRVVMVRHDHPLADRHQLSVQDLDPYPVVAPACPIDQRDWWIVNPRPGGAAAIFNRTAGNAGELLEAVAMTGDLTITTEAVAATYVRPDVRSIPLVGVDAAVISVAWHSASDDSDVRRFVQIAKANAETRRLSRGGPGLVIVESEEDPGSGLGGKPG
jgi:DNA-binding transcriptional LysR family regulator